MCIWINVHFCITMKRNYITKRLGNLNKKFVYSLLLTDLPLKRWIIEFPSQLIISVIWLTRTLNCRNKIAAKWVFGSIIIIISISRLLSWLWRYFHFIAPRAILWITQMWNIPQGRNRNSVFDWPVPEPGWSWASDNVWYWLGLRYRLYWTKLVTGGWVK